MLLFVVVSIATQNAFLALATILIFGVPHGALDGSAARHVLRPHYGRLWFLVFSVPYLALTALVLVFWRCAPEPTLIAFLLSSAVHFGRELAPTKEAWPVVAVLGGLPLFLPLYFHPQQTLDLLNGIMFAERFTTVPSTLIMSASLWFIGAALWVTFGKARAEPFPSLKVGFLGLIGVFYLLPPLMAFMVYFVYVHAPAHMCAVVKSPFFPRIKNLSDAIIWSLPLSLATLVLFFCLWPLYQGSALDRFLALTFQLLAALTLPHMLLELSLNIYAKKDRPRRWTAEEGGRHPA